MKIRTIVMTVVMAAVALANAANPVNGMLERIDRGASKKFATEIKADPSGEDYFEVSQKGGKVLVTGNDYVSVATGINWYLKNVLKIHLSWNGMTATLPEKLPVMAKPVRKSTDKKLRYDFNYCTYSYSMPFWNWERWEREIDWMALHGVNLPLAAVGQECVWRNMLTRLGYTADEINSFIAGPGFLAWWAMNNLEGWGGPLPDSWYASQEAMQKKILARMKEFGIKPVLPGYSGMMPSNADSKLGLNVIKSPLWNGFTRPAFIYPTDPAFAEMAALYYAEQQKLFGKADFYSMDPFHECKNADEFDFDAGGKAVMAAMKKVNPKAMWVVQAWSENPRQQMIDGLEAGDLLILDLFAECKPMWGIESPAKRENGFGNHKWLMCMLENFGANVGLHGRMDELLDNYRLISTHPLGKNCLGTGLTMEGSENNPVMFELMSELPWMDAVPSKEDWLRYYVKARYGSFDARIYDAWVILANSIYNAPMGNIQQGPHESIFCARPGLDNLQVSSWSKMKNYYDPTATREAARLMLEAAESFRGNNNFEYDLTDIVRQAIADEGRRTYQHAIADYKCFDRKAFEAGSKRFMDLLTMQNRLLATRSEFRVGSWIAKARDCGTTPEEKDLYEWNARVQITTWGPRQCADAGKLRDYAHKEWNGILKDFYYPRWEAFWQTLRDTFDGKPLETIDYYAMEEPWTLDKTPYPSAPEGDCIDTARDVFNAAFHP
ncbi:MAG: alpha-N-acetylglucosaminidase [Muribaculaceae bacterium]|nr:alpha-N-acetylglucosaminidase [Muribaculaceae bacterium]